MFPDAVQFGDIVEGLPVQEKSCEAVYCSHVLEHLSLDDFRTALSNTFAILRPGGLFRLVMPDLEVLARTYLEDLDAGSEGAAMAFMRGSGMALSSRPQSLRSKLASSLGNTRHQWLWDVPTAVAECERAGFEKVRRCSFGDSAESKFGEVEDEQRFIGAVSLEMTRS